MNNIIDTFIEIKLSDNQNFRKIRETLSRIGRSTKVDGQLTLYQTCYILKKGGKFYITHFKELYMLDDSNDGFSDVEINGEMTFFGTEDEKRRNTIVKLLVDWGLCEMSNDNDSPRFENTKVARLHIIKYNEIDKWVCESTYDIGNHTFEIDGNV